MSRDDVVFHALVALNLLALLALYRLRSPRSAVSRWLDRRIDAAIAAEFASGAGR